MNFSERISAIVLFILLPLAVGCNSGDSGNETSTKIGVLVPQTGEVATYGTAILNGIIVANEEYNAGITILVEDTQGNPRTGVAGARKLIETNRVQIIIGAVASSVTLAVAPVAENSHTVLLSPASSSPKITEAGDYIFRNYPSDTYEGAVAANFAFDNGLKTASVLVLNNDYGIGLRHVFEEVYVRKGGSIVSSDTFDEGASDFRPVLLRIRSKSPDTIFIVGYGKELGTIARQVSELGIDTQILSTVNFHDSQTITAGGASVEGAIFTSVDFDPVSNDVARDFAERYRSKFSAEPDVWAAHGYDAMKLVLQAVERFGGAQADSIKSFLYSVENWQGASGSTSFDKNGDVEKGLALMTVENGQFVPYLKDRD